jgi:hypothetical protein
MYDIMEERVTLVESLEKKRQPFPEMDVIYFVAPSAESVSKVVEDFKGQAMYRNVHLFFLSRIDAAAMAVLQASPKLVGCIKTFKEINVDFRVAEPFVFHLDMPPALAFRDLFVDSTTAFVQALTAKLFTVCASLHECPLVRCRADSPMEMVGMKLVGMLAELKASGAWWHYGMPGHQERPASVLLLLDRSEDLASPLLHACNYQSLVNDLLEVKDNVVSADVNGKHSEVLLSQKDELWVKFKHQHIAEVIDGLTAYLSDFKARHKGVSALNNKGAPSAGADNGAVSQSVADLGAVVKAMPEYQAQLAMYSLHNSLATRCTKMLQAKDGSLLTQINDVEQTLVTGYDQDGAALKLSSVLETMMDSLMTSDLSLKLRLTLLLVATQREKLKDADLDRACAMAGFTEEDKVVVTKLQSLIGGGSSSSGSPQTPGGQVEAAGGSTKKKGWGFTSKSIFGSSATSAAASSTGPEPFDYPSARFTPPLKGIANDLANDKLSTTDFPMVPGQENTSTAAAAPQSMRRAPGWSSKKATFAGGRNFVFVAGGVTHSELKAAADVSAATNKEVILGGTSILTPTEYLNALREM